MARNPIPTYRRHPRKDRAVIDIYDAAGRRTQRLLPGTFGSPESQSAYQRLIGKLQAHGGNLPSVSGQELPNDLTIDELVLRFLSEKVSVDYVDAHGDPTSEQLCFRQALKPLVRMYGWAVARDFDAKSLGGARDAMIGGTWMNAKERALLTKQKKPIGWCRSNINKSISRIRSLFRWAVLYKIVPASVVVDLGCLPPLKAGRGGVRETDPVVPVPLAVVESTSPWLPPVVRDMVRLQLLLACRPGELCGMRMGDIDRAGPIWFYAPESHKTKHFGHKRTIAIGPQAQVLLRQYLKQDPKAFLFSPAEQDRIIKDQKRASRKTPVQPSQIDRSNPKAKRKPGNQFTVRAYNRSVVRGSRKAGVASWHVHQLRHTAALLVSREYGAEAARAVLGHRTLNMTLHYAGIDAERAAEVAAKTG
jgi:integrase